MTQIMNRARRLSLIIIALLKQRGIQSLAVSFWRLLRRDGVRGVWRRVNRAHRNNYVKWAARFDTLNDETRQVIRCKIQAMPSQPKISIVFPVYNPEVRLLEEAIESVRNQLYPNWELCIADDASKNADVLASLQKHASEDSRIKLILRPENGHICQASNSALALATGEFVALMDHDDVLPEHALFWVAETIVAHPDVGLIYSDEDKIDLKGVRQDPYFKPDWSPDLFLSQNFISHLGVYRTSLLRDIHGFRVGFEGSQDYDLALRCIERLRPEQIIHIPRVLYHWRIHPHSTALSIASKPYATISAEKALNEYLQRQGIAGHADAVKSGYRVQYDLPDERPLVTLIIPTRNGFALLKQCVESILTKTTYPNYDILIIDNGSDDPEILRYFEILSAQQTIRVIRDAQPFNYSALNNAAVAQARGTIIGLINNDIEVISADWLSEMVSLAIQPGVGAVGAKLHYPDDTLQHAGIVLGLGGAAGHSHRYFPNTHPGFCARTILINNYSAVTAACLVIQKAIYEEVGGLNELELKVAYNDVDFCLKLKEAGYRNIWTPYAELYHHESVSRGIDDTPEKKARFMDEVHYLNRRWETFLQADPAYNPNLSLYHEDFSLAWPPRVVNQ